MLLLAQYGVRHGVEIAVNWPGRISVFPIMGGIFLALVVDGWVPDALLIVGLVLAIARYRSIRRTGARVSEGAARPGSINLQPRVEPLATRPIIVAAANGGDGLLDQGARWRTPFPISVRSATKS